MPVRPMPISFECPECGWTKTIEPLSDVLIEAPMGVCPKCGHQHLVAKRISFSPVVLSALTNAFRKILSN